MGKDDRLFDVLDELEGAAEAAYAAERDHEVADRSRAEYAQVTLASRLMASVGGSVSLEVAGVGRVHGELRRVATGWCALAGRGGDWLVPLAAVEVAHGLSERAVPEVAWSPLSRLGFGSPLRRLADEGAACVVITQAGDRHEVVLDRVGADFVEAHTVGEQSARVVLALAATAAVRVRL